MAGVLLSAAFVSCEKELSVAGSAEGNSVLNVVTRSGESDAKVSYPVTVYVMNGDGQCVRRQQLLSASDQLQLKLQPMTYQVYAVGGATEGDYSLPGQEDATATSEVTLNADAVHGDLMTAKNTVTLTDAETTTLTLSMSRRVMHLESLVVKNVPQTVDGVTMTLAPLYDNLLLNGEYSASTSEQALTLTEQVDGTTWQNADGLYLLPSADKATITVRFLRGTTIKSYAYSCPVALVANRHIRIIGTFTGTDELILVGSITGATWEGTTTIEFTFDSEGSATTTISDDTGGSGDDGGNQGEVVEGATPTAGSVYQDCYVLSTADDGGYTVVTLVHKHEAEIDGSGKAISVLETEINEALETFEINGITGWRLPAEAEINAFTRGMFLGLTGFTPLYNDNYYYQGSNGIDAALISDMGVGLARGYSVGKRLRPVTTLKFRKE